MGSYNKTAQIEKFIKNRNAFLTVLKAGKSKVKAAADSVIGGGPHLFHSWHRLTTSSPGGMGRAAVWVSFIKALILFTSAETPEPNHPNNPTSQ